jgi:hypothetical protein
MGNPAATTKSAEIIQNSPRRTLISLLAKQTCIGNVAMTTTVVRCPHCVLDDEFREMMLGLSAGIPASKVAALALSWHVDIVETNMTRRPPNSAGPLPDSGPQNEVRQRK